MDHQIGNQSVYPDGDMTDDVEYHVSEYQPEPAKEKISWPMIEWARHLVNCQGSYGDNWSDQDIREYCRVNDDLIEEADISEEDELKEEPEALIYYRVMNLTKKLTKLRKLRETALEFVRGTMTMDDEQSSQVSEVTDMVQEICL